MSINYCIIGAFSSGKTSLTQTFIKHRQNVDNDSTIGASLIVNYFSSKNGNKIKLNIWDTAGQERYSSLLPMYSRSADVIIFTIDPTNEESITYIEKMTSIIFEHRLTTPPLSVKIVVTKMDTQYGEEYGKELINKVKKYLITYFTEKNLLELIKIKEYLTSSMTCYNVEHTFIDECEELLERKNTNNTTNIIKIKDDNKNPNQLSCLNCGII